MHWTVGRKIGLGYLIVALALLSVGLIAQRSLSGLLEAARWKEHTFAVLHQLDQINTLLKDAETGQRGYLLTGRDSYLAPYQQALRDLPSALRALAELTRDNPAQQQRQQALQQALHSKLSELRDTIALRRTQGLAAAQAVVQSDRGKQWMDRIRVVMTDMGAEEQRLLQQRDQAQLQRANLALAVLRYGIPAALLAMLLAAWAVGRNIVGPLAELTQAASLIAAGNLAPRLSSQPRRDELGQLREAFASMASSLRSKASLASQIATGDLRVAPPLSSTQDELGLALRNMVEKLQAVVGSLQQGKQLMAGVVGTVSSGAQQVSQATDETAVAITQLATTIAELRQSSEITAQRMAAVSHNSSGAAEVAQDGRKAVADTAQAMDEIQQRMHLVGERIAELTERSLDISAIISVVNALAEQAAILAVNASVEAAHAGEQGGGFVAVAQEMKTLAGQSKQAVSEVRRILLDIPPTISALLQATEQSSAAVHIGVNRVGVAGEALARMASEAHSNAEAAQQIASSALQQLSGVQQLAAAILQIKQDNQANLHSMRQMQQATQDLQQTNQQLTRAIEHFQR